MTYLPSGLPAPSVTEDGLWRPFWDGLRRHRLMIQHCRSCGRWQHGPEWICHACHAFDPAWDSVPPVGTLHSFVRVWHPAHPALVSRGPYMLAVVALPGAAGARVIGNLLLAEGQEAVIGQAVLGHFEDHDTADPPFTLLQWSPASLT